MKRLVTLLILFTIIAGCGSKPAVKVRPTQSRFTAADKNKLSYVARGYLGTPYRYGGMTKRGFDCSGLLVKVFSEALSIKIPRTVRSQYTASYAVRPGKVQVGDIVFFKIKGERLNHAGMLIGKGKFIHATRSRGVVISSLDDKYYRRYFSGIRRLSNRYLSQK